MKCWIVDLGYCKQDDGLQDPLFDLLFPTNGYCRMCTERDRVRLKYESLLYRRTKPWELESFSPSKGVTFFAPDTYGEVLNSQGASVRIKNRGKPMSQYSRPVWISDCMKSLVPI